MASDIRKARPDAHVELVGEEDKPGTFNVSADAKPLWNKHDKGAFPKPAEILAQLPDAPTS